LLEQAKDDPSPPAVLMQVRRDCVELWRQKSITNQITLVSKSQTGKV
jgi:hypothetical protein